MICFLSRPSNICRQGKALTVDFHFTANTNAYLKTRLRNISERERLIALVIDEVVTAKRVEFVGSCFYVNENSDITKTLLCVMIKSVCGKYQDMVALLPISSTNSEKIVRLYFQVLKGVSEIGFEAFVSLVDGNKTNMRFYKDLGQGQTWPTKITRPDNLLFAAKNRRPVF